ncbi:MAG: nucleotide exchange factor GrpE [Bacteroidota bacterium]
MSRRHFPFSFASQFVPLAPIGSILDSLTFAHNFETMAEKDTTQQAPENEGGIDINSDETMNGTTHLNNPVDIDSELDKLKAELDEAKDKYLRKVAEFENFKRRNAKERLELIQTAGREVINDMLDVLDDLRSCAKANGKK